MARQDLRVMLRRGGTRRYRRVRHIINHTRRSRSKHRRTPPVKQAGIPRLRHLVAGRSLLLHHRARLLPLDPHVALPRKGFRHGLASETPPWPHVALRFHNFHCDLIL